MWEDLASTVGNTIPQSRVLNYTGVEKLNTSRQTSERNIHFALEGRCDVTSQVNFCDSPAVTNYNLEL